MDRFIKTRRNNNGKRIADYSEMTFEQYIHEATYPIENAVKRAETAAELHSHIEEGIEYYTEHGNDEKEAIKKTLVGMGDPRVLSTEFRKLYPGRIDWFVLLITLLYCVLCYVYIRISHVPDLDSEFTLYTLLIEACTVGMTGVFISVAAAVGVRTPMHIALFSSLFINASGVVYNCFLHPSAQFLFVLYSLFEGDYGELPRIASKCGNEITLKNYHAVSVVFFLVYFAAAVGVYITHGKMRSPSCNMRWVKYNKILRRSLLTAGILICVIDLTAAYTTYRGQKTGEAYEEAYAGYYVFEDGGTGDIESLFSARISGESENGLPEEDKDPETETDFTPDNSVTIHTSTRSFEIYSRSGTGFLSGSHHFEQRGTAQYNTAVKMNVYLVDVSAKPKGGYLALIPMDRAYRPLFAKAEWKPVPKSGEELLLPCSSGYDANIFIRLVYDPDA